MNINQIGESADCRNSTPKQIHSDLHEYDIKSHRRKLDQQKIQISSPRVSLNSQKLAKVPAINNTVYCSQFKMLTGLNNQQAPRVTIFSEIQRQAALSPGPANYLHDQVLTPRRKQKGQTLNVASPQNSKIKGYSFGIKTELPKSKAAIIVAKTNQLINSDSLFSLTSRSPQTTMSYAKRVTAESLIIQKETPGVGSYNIASQKGKAVGPSFGQKYKSVKNETPGPQYYHQLSPNSSFTIGNDKKEKQVLSPQRSKYVFIDLVPESSKIKQPQKVRVEICNTSIGKSVLFEQRKHSSKGVQVTRVKSSSILLKQRL